jgi:hypothetical protein
MKTLFPRSALLAILLGALTTLRADPVVAPNSMATGDEVLGSGVLRASNYRSQTAYGSSHFPQEIALLITELRFRPDRQYGQAFTGSIPNIRIDLSTTTRSPDALSPAYASNVGADNTVVFSGSLSISSANSGPPNGPREFDIVVPLSTPFLYNPAAGHLLVDIRNFSGSTASHLSGSSATSDGASRVGGNLQVASGTTDRAAEALLIVYAPTNQPPPPPTPLQPTALVRGPYLQNASKTNIAVHWRTTVATNSVVQFGLSPSNLQWAITNSGSRVNHIVNLTNLSPDTRYYYAVGNVGTNLALGTDYFFYTAPASNRPTRVWIMGDFGTASNPFFGQINDQLGMRDAYYNFTSNRYTDVWLMLGDNAYFNGTDDEYQTNVFEVFPTILRQTVPWSTIGNHDAANTSTYLDIFNFPKNGEAGGVPSGTELYYSFDYGNIHFVCIDSENSSREPGSPMLEWLEADLAANTNQWIIAFWHSPPYSYSSHNSDDINDSAGRLFDMRENVVPILEQYGVDLVLCGHSHAYERSKLIDGHYGVASTFTPAMAKDGGSGREDETGPYLKAGAGPTPHEGAVYSVVGSSGWVTPGHPTIPAGLYLKHPAMYIGLPKVGSLVLDVNTNRLDAKFVSNTGTIDDYFTIRKGAGPEPLRIDSVRLADGIVTLRFNTVTNRNYRVLRATSLNPPNWTPASSVINASGPTTTWSTQLEPTGEHYFQVLQLP